MAIDPRVVNSTGSWMGPQHQHMPQRILNTAQGNSSMAPLRTPPSNHQYEYVRSTRFSASRFWREAREPRAVAQQAYSGVVQVPTSAPPGRLETLTFVGNINQPQPTSVRRSLVAPTRPVTEAPVRTEGLTFVGNFTHAPSDTQDVVQLIALLNSRQASVSRSATSHGVTPTQSPSLNPASPVNSHSGIVQHSHLSPVIAAQMPAQQQELQSTTGIHQSGTGASVNVTHVPLPTAESGNSFEDVMNIIVRPDDTAALVKEFGPLRFVGNFMLPAKIHQGLQSTTPKPAHVPDTMAQGGAKVAQVGPERVNTPPSTSAVLPSPLVDGSEVPAQSKSSTGQYNREEWLKMMEYHRNMATYYRKLKRKAEGIPDSEESVEVEGQPQRKIQKRIKVKNWEELEEATQGMVLPDDAVEKLDEIPGIWDLAAEMGFVTECSENY